MKANYRKIWMGTILLGFVLSFSDCVKYPTNTWVKEVIDLKPHQEGEWELEYDYKGRLIQYGTTPITYDSDKIIIGTMTSEGVGEKLFSAVFHPGEENGMECESLCVLKVDSVWKDVVKNVRYEWVNDTLFVHAIYKDRKTRKCLREMDARYVYASDRSLMETVTRYIDAKGESSSCHSFYDNSSNITYDANLNLQAYIIDWEGWDIFFYFLLNMDGGTVMKSLPNRIEHCVDHGKAVYVADGLYRMDGDRPIRMELISDEVQLKARYELKYWE